MIFVSGHSSPNANILRSVSTAQQAIANLTLRNRNRARHGRTTTEITMKKAVFVALAVLGVVLGGLSFVSDAHAAYAPNGKGGNVWYDEPNG